MSSSRRLGVQISTVMVAALAIGLVAGWIGGDMATAGQKVFLAQAVDLNTLPAPRGNEASYTHVIYIKRVKGQHITRIINELHAAMAERGWAYLEMMPHMEDGDLRGLWVVYQENGYESR